MAQRTSNSCPTEDHGAAAPSRQWRFGRCVCPIAAVVALLAGLVAWNRLSSRDIRRGSRGPLAPALSALAEKPSIVGHSSVSADRGARSDGELSNDGMGKLAVVPPTDNIKKRLADQRATLSPLSDGWQSEHLAERVSAQLGHLAHAMAEPDSIEPSATQAVAAADFGCGPLRPPDLREEFRHQGLVVSRPPAAPRPTPAAVQYRGPNGLREALETLAGMVGGQPPLRVKFKVVGVDVSNDMIRVQAYYEAAGRAADSAAQQTATWTTRWRRSAGDEDPRLLEIVVQDFEEVRFHTARATMFSDWTDAVLGGCESYRRQLRFGAGYWMQRLERDVSPRLMEGHWGVALGDADGDGLEDVYLSQAAGLPNRLLIRQADGTLADAPPDAGVDIVDWSNSALFVDVDNDADQDLAVLTGSALLVFANNGRGKFDLKTRVPGQWEYCVTAADYDRDGDLDFYICNYFVEATDGLTLTGRRDPFHNSNNGGPNTLLRNDGDWQFTDVTEQVGMGANNRRWSYAAAWEDYDDDGDQDLYVANDFGPNNLYRNDGAAFVDVAADNGALDANFGMSASWGDYDRDGHIDLYVANMFSSAGNRITRQQQFQRAASDEARDVFKRLARGNTLLRNQGDGTFRDMSESAGVTMGRWSWGSLFVDINNDGWEDLLVLNGFLTQQSPDDL